MDRVRLNEVQEIPLFLLPHAIAQQIKKTGNRIYRISVKRTHQHHYNVSVRTRTLPRELTPGRGNLTLSFPTSNARRCGSGAGGRP
jgi:hypothetical protein